MFHRSYGLAHIRTSNIRSTRTLNTPVSKYRLTSLDTHLSTTNLYHDESWAVLHIAGRWLNGKPHGVGKLEWTDGRMYTGQFHKGVIQGTGKMEMPTQGIYEGQWKDGQQNGHGSFKSVTFQAVPLFPLRNYSQARMSTLLLNLCLNIIFTDEILKTCKKKL